MSKLFEKKSPSDIRGRILPIRVTQGEHVEITHLASIRNLAVADFVRRAALGRRADVDYHTDIVLALSNVVKSIRELRAAIAETGRPPQDEVLMLVLREAIAAMLRIAK